MCVEEVGCHVCPESAHGACLLVPMTWLDALEFYGTYEYEKAVDEDIMIVDSILDSMICLF